MNEFDDPKNEAACQPVYPDNRIQRTAKQLSKGCRKSRIVKGYYQVENQNKPFFDLKIMLKTLNYMGLTTTKTQKSDCLQHDHFTTGSVTGNLIEQVPNSYFANFMGKTI